MSKFERNHASVVLQSAFRSHQSRLALRAIAKSVYKKTFDTENFHEYFVNTRTDAIFLKKPLALGLSELPFDDDWVEGRDSSGVPYFVNFHTMNMQWSQPWASPGPGPGRNIDAPGSDTSVDLATNSHSVQKQPLLKAACSQCDEVVAKRRCYQCLACFCVDCFIAVHSMGSMRAHLFHNI